jgi:hypothetical protein
MGPRFQPSFANRHQSSRARGFANSDGMGRIAHEFAMTRCLRIVQMVPPTTIRLESDDKKIAEAWIKASRSAHTGTRSLSCHFGKFFLRCITLAAKLCPGQLLRSPEPMWRLCGDKSASSGD